MWGVPPKALLSDKLLELCVGCSIGLNEMTQRTVGLDGDSGMELLAQDFDERDDAVKFMLGRAIRACLAANKSGGICGQGPSDHPDLAQWLCDEGILSMSLNPDTVVQTWQSLARQP